MSKMCPEMLVEAPVAFYEYYGEACQPARLENSTNIEKSAWVVYFVHKDVMR